MVGNASSSSSYDRIAFRRHQVAKIFTYMTTLPNGIKTEADQLQRLTGLLQMLLVVAVVTSLLSALIILVTSSQPMMISGLVIGLAIFYLGLLLFLRRERARFFGLISLFISWLALSLSAVLLNNGLSSPLIDAYVLVVVMAGLLLGSEIGYRFTTLSILTNIGFYLVERAGFIGVEWGGSSAEFVTSIRLIHLMVAYVLIYLITKSQKTEASRAYAHKIALEEKNREMHMIQDALEQRVSERSAEILMQSQYFKALVDNIPVAVVTLDLDNRIIACNPAFEDLFQYAQEEIIQRRLDRLITDERTQAEAENYTQRAIHGEVVNYKSVRYRKDLIPIDVDIFGVPVVVEDRQVGVLVLYHDITERKHAEVILQHIANHDALTGLPNRMLFFDRLSHATQKASRSGEKLAVAFLDLDNFKTVNDTHGHGKGDLILKEVAERLKSGVRVSDTIARMGGDEFTFIFEAINSPQDALNISQKIVDTLIQPFELDGSPVVITASIGVSLYPDDGIDTLVLLKKADEAMYASKLLGQNRSQIYTAKSEEQAVFFQEESIESNKRAG